MPTMVLWTTSNTQHTTTSLYIFAIAPSVDFYIWDPETENKHYINCNAAFWNDQDWHGGENSTEVEYGLRIDCKFTPEFRKKNRNRSSGALLMRIGFFGDSFCENNREGFLGLTRTIDSYIDLTIDHYNAKLTNVGIGGSSHWDLILNQFMPVKELPDVCIFLWTDHTRLYHKKVRQLRLNSALDYSKSFKIGPSYGYGLNSNVWKAAEQYYKHLYDDKKSQIEYTGSLMYFNNLIKDIDRKFIHLWSFAPPTDFNWSTGMEIRSGLEETFDTMDIAPNHLPSQLDNFKIFKTIQYCIDNYENGKSCEIS